MYKKILSITNNQGEPTKTTMRYHLISVRMATIKKTKKKKNKIKKPKEPQKNPHKRHDMLVRMWRN